MLNKEKEYWKPIPEFEGLYMCSTLGNIKRVERYVWLAKNIKSILTHEVFEANAYKVKENDKL